jgi:hypothetical protein
MYRNRAKAAHHLQSQAAAAAAVGPPVGAAPGGWQQPGQQQQQLGQQQQHQLEQQQQVPFFNPASYQNGSAAQLTANHQNYYGAGTSNCSFNFYYVPSKETVKGKSEAIRIP